MGKSFHSFFGTRHSYWEKYITCFQKTVKNSKSNQVPFAVCFEISKQTAKGALKFQSKLQRALWSFKANCKGRFEVSKQITKGALKFQSKLQRQLCSFKANFKVSLHFYRNFKLPLKFALKLQTYLCSLHWNFKASFAVCFEISNQTSRVVWSLLWNFKANFKGHLVSLAMF